MKRFISGLLSIAGIAGGLYVGLWLMFIQPILEACKAFDAGMITGTIVGITILKCIFAGTEGALIAYIEIAIGGVMAND